MEGQNCDRDGLNKPQTAVIMVPFPAQGHLNQLLHLSNILTTYQIPVHYAGSATHNRQAKLRIQGWDTTNLSKIQFHDFELPPYNSPPPNPNATTPFPDHLQPCWDASLHLRQPVCHLMQQLSQKFKRIVVIHDTLLASVVQDVKFITNAEAYNFLPISAFHMFFRIWDGLSEKPFHVDFDIPTSILPSIEGCATEEIKNFANYQRNFLDFQSGKLYNSCRQIEGKYIELLERLYTNHDLGQKHFAIGPLNPVETKNTSKGRRHGCLEWLDEQDKDSVLYVSFGSSTSLREEQIRELAKGLERSEQNFIWVVRNADKGDIFAGDETEKPRLDEGYEERVKGRGLVVRDWAPQLEILGHPSTGGFMSHCGWNSCLESISTGVPIAAWPMHSDQPKNAVLVTQVLRIGTIVRDWHHREELVTSNAIENVVRRLMASRDGAEMRERAKELGNVVQSSVSKGGASNLELEAFITHITR